MSAVRLQRSPSPRLQVSAAFMVDTSGVIAISTPQARITSRVTLTSKALEAEVVVAAMVILVVIRTAPVKSKVIISGVDQARDQPTNYHFGAQPTGANGQPAPASSQGSSMYERV